MQVGQRFLNESVLMVGSAEATVIGSPLIEGATVEGIIEEQARCLVNRAWLQLN